MPITKSKDAEGKHTGYDFFYGYTGKLCYFTVVLEVTRRAS